MPSTSDLPPTSDKEFWGDGKTYQTQKFRESPSKEHYLDWVGPHAVCFSCKYKHTVPLDPNKYDLKDGRIVKLGKRVIK